MADGVASSGALPEGYGPRDAERHLPEGHTSGRSDFERDRARVLHSSALRRLAAKTQVLSPTAGIDFARNRLTHSLEVAQVGRELGSRLGLDPDVVDAACLSHDLGHPPYGHNGEKALNDWAEGIGGFEGNAQTLRVLTRLEPKVVGPNGVFYGLNLTRASLDASCKYPWPAAHAVPDPGGRMKFGFYDDDMPAFQWLRQGAPAGIRCIEAQVMDLSDDIAYSVHDFEDAVVAGNLDLDRLASGVRHDALLQRVDAWTGHDVGLERLEAAYRRLEALPGWLTAWSGTRADLARLKNFTSTLIGRFAGHAERATRHAYPQRSLARFGADVVVPDETRAEIAVLKGIVGATVMGSDARQPLYRDQRILLTELLDALWQAGDANLDVPFRDDWRAASDDTARKRVIVDQAASLTDQGAENWHRRLVRRES